MGDLLPTTSRTSVRHASDRRTEGSVRISGSSHSDSFTTQWWRSPWIKQLRSVLIGGTREVGGVHGLGNTSRNRRRSGAVEFDKDGHLFRVAKPLLTRWRTWKPTIIALAACACVAMVLLTSGKQSREAVDASNMKGNTLKPRIDHLGREIIPEDKPDVGEGNDEDNERADGDKNDAEIDQELDEADAGLSKTDLVFTVHNQGEIFRTAVDSLVASDTCDDMVPGEVVDVYVVDTQSDNEDTLRYLDDLDETQDRCFHFHIIKSGTSSYTKSANLGLQVGKASRVVLLNSDIILSNGWLAGLHEALDSGSQVRIAGPLSNAAMYQSVPVVNPAEWSLNPLPNGIEVDDLASFFRDERIPLYPRIPLLNGFVLAFDRRIFDEIGYFNDTLFPVGYGEENEFCYRVRKAGFTLALADSVYVYHEKSKSFGNSQRRKLVQQAIASYPPAVAQYIKDAYVEMLHDKTLVRLRQDTAYWLGMAP